MSVIGQDLLKARRTLAVGGKQYDYFSLEAAAAAAGLGDIARLPFSLKVLLENLLRLENGRTVTVDDIKAVAQWLTDAHLRARDRLPPGARADAGLDRRAGRGRSRGDARRDGQARRRPQAINPLSPVDLVIDHSVMVDNFGTRECLPPERQDRVRAQRRALCLPALGPERVRQFPRRAAGHRHLPSGQSRISRAGGVDHRRGRPRSSPIPTRWSAPTATPP